MMKKMMSVWTRGKGGRQEAGEEYLQLNKKENKDGVGGFCQ
jgi:hypothetical protein